MNTKELQIGDWVNYRGTNIQVSSLYDKGGSNEIGWGDKESTWVNGRCIEPIPLTEEILEKNGFKIMRNQQSYEYRGYPNGDFEVVDKCSVFFNQQRKPPFMLQVIRLLKLSTEEKINLHVQYIHQLQQAFRLLGIEKEFVI